MNHLNNFGVNAMARSEKRRSLTARLKDENEQLRDAARQLLAGLSEYAKETNWHKRKLDIDGTPTQLTENLWVGEGDGPAVARKFLGLDQENN